MLTVTNTGTIEGTDTFSVVDIDGVDTGIGGVGIWVVSDNTDTPSVITNDGGTIEGTLAGVRAEGGILNVTNRNAGQIVATGEVVEVGDPGAEEPFGGVGVWLENTLAGTWVNNQAGAVISGELAGVGVVGGQAVIDNAGTISGGTGGAGLSVVGGTATINNTATGEITGEVGLDIFGNAEATVNNEGRVSGETGILVEASDAVVINNHGQIIGTVYDGVMFENAGIDAGNRAALVNYGGGVIEGAEAGVYVEGGFVSIDSQAGATITGGDFGVTATTGANIILDNAGTITGGQHSIKLNNAANGTEINNLAGGQILNGIDIVGGYGDIYNAQGATISSDVSGFVIDTSAVNSTIENRGTISGIEAFQMGEVSPGVWDVVEGSIGIGLVSVSDAVTTAIENYGIISGSYIGVLAEIESGGTSILTTIDNYGTIRGTADIVEIEIGGEDYHFGGIGIALEETAVGTTVTNRSDALISGGHRGIYVQDGFADIINAGTIRGTGADSHGITVGEGIADIDNLAGGLITGGWSGIGVFNQDSSGHLTEIDNAGEIIGDVFGVYAENGGIYIDNLAGGYIYGSESGIEIVGASDGADVYNREGARIVGGWNGVFAGASDVLIENRGTIEGDLWGVDMNHDPMNALGDRLQLDNYGDIIGGGWAVNIGEGTALINHYAGEIRVTGQIPQATYNEMMAWIAAEDPGFEMPESFGSAAIFLGGIGDRPGDDGDRGTEGGTVNLYADVFGDIVHAGDSTGALLTLNDGPADSAVVDGDILWGVGTVRQNSGVWSIGDVETGAVEMGGGELSTGEIAAATVAVSGGQMTTSGILAATTSVDVSGGELTADSVGTQTVAVEVGTLNVADTLSATTSVTLTSGELTAGDVITDVAGVGGGTMTVDGTLTAATSVGLTGGALTAGEIWTTNVTVNDGTLTIDGMLDAGTSVIVSGGQLLANNLTTDAVTVNGGLLAIDGILDTLAATINDGGAMRLAGSAAHEYGTLSMQRGGTIASNGALNLAADRFVLLDAGGVAYGFDTALGNIAVSDLTLGWASTFNVNADGQELVLRDLDTGGNVITLGTGVLRLTGGGTSIDSDPGTTYFELASVVGSTVIVDFTGGTIGDDVFNKAVNTTLEGDIAFSGAAATFLPNVEYDEPSNTLTATDFDFTAGALIATPEGGTLNLTGTTVLSGDINGPNPFIGSGTINIDQIDEFNGATTFDFRGGGTLNLDVLPTDTDPLTLTGAGRFNLGQPGSISDSSGYTGLLTLAGTDSLILALNSNVGGNVTLDNPNSELWGVGTIGGHLSILQGWHRPGNSIGVQIVEGDYEIASGATLEIEFAAGQDNCDRVEVGGTATITDGAILQLVDLSGGTVASGTTYTYLTATSLVYSAGFTLADLPLYTAVLNYELDSAWFELTRDAAPTLNPVSRNQQSMANALDLAWNGGNLADLEILFAAFATEAEQNKALTELAPEPYRANRIATMRQAQMMARQWSANSRQMRPAYGQINTLDYLAQAPAEHAPGTATDYRNPHAMGGGRSGVSKDGWGAFLRPFGQYGSQDSGVDQTGFTFRTAGIIAGVDKAVSDDMIVGLGLGYTYSSVRFKQSRGKSDIDSLRAGPYVSYQWDDVQIDASLSAGMHWFDMAKQMPELGLRATNDHKGYDVSAYLGASMNYEYNKWTVSPGASLQYTHLWEDSFRETGAGAANQRIDSQRTHSLRSLLGVTLLGKESFIWDSVRPTLFAGWGFEMLDNDTTITGRFVDAPDATFRVRAAGPGRHSGIFGAGLNFDINAAANGFVNYQAEVTSRSDHHTLMGGVSWTF